MKLLGVGSGAVEGGCGLVEDAGVLDGAALVEGAEFASPGPASLAVPVSSKAAYWVPGLVVGAGLGLLKASSRASWKSLVVLVSVLVLVLGALSGLCSVGEAEPSSAPVSAPTSCLAGLSPSLSILALASASPVGPPGV